MYFFSYFIYQFTYPSLFDNRNFYHSNENFDFKTTIQKIIPEIFQTYLKNLEKKIFIFLGNYNLKHLYTINAFVENEFNFLFKVNILNELFYIILTETCILIFIPVNIIKGKLIFVEEIRNIHFCEIKNPNDKNDFLLNIKFNDNNGLILNFKQKCDVVLFNSIIQERKNLIYKKIKEFKIVKFEETHESLLLFIKYKEKEFTEKKEEKENLKNELIILYQKAIEYYSSKNNDKYEIFMTKLKKLFEDNK